jgi:hypothetical protein
MVRKNVPYDYDISIAAAVQIGAQAYRCWRNAMLAFLLLPERFPFGQYIEGWIVVPRERERRIEITEHGWIVDGDRIIDPSIVLIEDQSQPVSYFPGLRLSRSCLYQQLHGRTLPLVCHSQFGADGMAHKEYKEAYEQAWQKAKVLATEKHIPQLAIQVRRRDPRIGRTAIVE